MGMSRQHLEGETTFQKLEGKELQIFDSKEKAKFKVSFSNIKREIPIFGCIPDAMFYSNDELGLFEFVATHKIPFAKKINYWQRDVLALSANCNRDYLTGCLNAQNPQSFQKLIEQRLEFINNPHSSIVFKNGEKGDTYEIKNIFFNKEAFVVITKTQKESKAILVSYCDVSDEMTKEFKKFCQKRQFVGYLAEIQTKIDYKEFLKEEELVQL